MPKFKYNSARYKEWRLIIYKRDHYTCQLCGEKGNLNAHHIERKADAPRKVYDYKNGITLCQECHNTVTGYEPVFAPLFEEIVHKRLTAKFILEFFEKLAAYYPLLVAELVAKDKWEVIPIQMTKKLKQLTTYEKIKKTLSSRRSGKPVSV